MKLFLAIALVGMAATFSAAQAQGQSGAAARIEVCKLLPREEVKKHLPWEKMFDQMPVEETPIGTTGSSCNYPTVDVQVLAFTTTFIDALRKQGQGALESISGVGDEAFFRNNRNEYAEIFVRIGNRLLTLQADGDGDVTAAKPKVINLAKAYVDKLRR